MKLRTCHSFTVRTLVDFQLSVISTSQLICVASNKPSLFCLFVSLSVHRLCLFCLSALRLFTFVKPLRNSAGRPNRSQKPTSESIPASNIYHCDSAVTALSFAIAVTLITPCTPLSQHWHCQSYPSNVTLPLLSQCCHSQRSNITSSVNAVTTLCSFSLPQRSVRFRCHNTVQIVVLPF